MADSKLVGKVEVKTTQYGEMMKVSFGPRDFEALEQAKNEKGWVNLVIKTSKAGGKYMAVDDWKPTQGQQAPQQPIQDIPYEDLPF